MLGGVRGGLSRFREAKRTASKCLVRVKRRMTMYSRRTDMFLAITLAAVFYVIQSEAADGRYQKPPRDVQDVFNAAPFPIAFPNPSGDTLLLAAPVLYPPIGELAKSM